MPRPDSQRPTFTNIDLDNLAFNFHSVKRFVGSDVEYMAVVKADAYGHGAVECSKRLESEGIDWFGVAIPEEGVELRRNGIRKPILCLGGFWDGQEHLLLNHQLSTVIYSSEMARKLNKAAFHRDIVAKIHVKIDTGMGRIGIRENQITEIAALLCSFKNLEVEGVMTHFAVADNLAENDFTRLQIDRFNSAVRVFEDHGLNPKFKDMANSPGAIAHKESKGNLVRIGGVLYGLGGDVLPAKIKKPELRPVLSLYSEIAQLKTVPKGESLGYGRSFRTKRESLIATIPIGYQDGLPRQLSNHGLVIAKGALAPIVGIISMDWAIIDVTGIPNINVNDEVVLIGEQLGTSILAEDLAKELGTISYEITCGISRRVIRHYIGTVNSVS